MPSSWHAMRPGASKQEETCYCRSPLPCSMLSYSVRAGTAATMWHDVFASVHHGDMLAVCFGHHLGPTSRDGTQSMLSIVVALEVQSLTIFSSACRRFSTVHRCLQVETGWAVRQPSAPSSLDSRPDGISAYHIWGFSRQTCWLARQPLSPRQLYPAAGSHRHSGGIYLSTVYR